MSTYVAPSRGGNDLLRGGAELVDVALTAARASNALKRRTAGATLDAEDRAALGAVQELLNRAAGAVDFFSAVEPPAVGLPNTVAPRVNATIEAALVAEPGGDPAVISQRLHELAANLGQVAAVLSAEPSVASKSFLDAFSSSILQRTGHDGEVTSLM